MIILLNPLTTKVSINNIHFTQDFAGVINKREVIHYLIENKRYVMEGYILIGDYIKMDNNKMVGKNCSTLIHKTEHGRVICENPRSQYY